MATESHGIPQSRPAAEGAASHAGTGGSSTSPVAPDGHPPQKPPRGREAASALPCEPEKPGLLKRMYPHVFNRWVFQFLLFIYLIAMAMTLFEIDAFHTQISQLVDSSTGDRTSRQRDVLQAVRGSLPPRRGDDVPVSEQKQALFERVAAKLDGLRVAIGAMEDIGARSTFRVRDDHTYKRAQQELFGDLADRIGLAMIDLRGQIDQLTWCGEGPETSSGCEGTKNLRASLGLLDEGVSFLGGLLPPFDQGAEPQDPRIDPERAAQLVAEINQVADDLAADLDESLAPAITAAEKLTPMGRNLEQIADLLEENHRDAEANFESALGELKRLSEQPLVDVGPRVNLGLDEIDRLMSVNREAALIELKRITEELINLIAEVEKGELEGDGASSETETNPVEGDQPAPPVGELGQVRFGTTDDGRDVQEAFVRVRSKLAEMRQDLRAVYSGFEDSSGQTQVGVDELLRTIRDLSSNLNDLTALASSDRISGKLGDIKDRSEALQKAIAQAAAAEVDKGAKGGKEEKESAKQLIDELSRKLAELQSVGAEELMVVIDSSIPEKEDAEAGGERGELEPIGGTGLLQVGSVADQVRDLRSTLVAFGIFQGKAKDYPALEESEGKDPRRMDAELAEIVARFQREVGFSGKDVDGMVGSETRKKLEAFRKECNQNLDKCGRSGAAEDDRGGGSLRDPVPHIRLLLTGLQTLRGLVAEQDVDLQEISELRGELAKIELASRRLAELDIQVEQRPGTDRDERKALEENRRQFQQATLNLEVAIKSMRETLADSTGIIRIANAIGGSDRQSHMKAATILQEYEALQRYQDILTPFAFLMLPRPECGESWGRNIACWPVFAFVTVWNKIADVGFHASELATMSRQALDMMVVFVMGAIGSLIYLIRYLLGQILKDHEEGMPVWRPLTWYVFRPLFGIVVAFSVYLLYKTGQVALGGATGNVLGSDVNLPILSIFSLFAGLLSWQALEMVESKGRNWLSAQRRENLWASGLRQALRNGGKTVSDCASQVGVTPTQVDRWIAGQDKVTSEMQDRILTWLNRRRVEVFGDVNPRDIDEGTLRWATGLKGALKANQAGIDVPRLAQLVEQDVETVQAWVDLKRQVDQKMQLLIADKLGLERDTLFTAERPDAEYWAIGLRTAMSKAGMSAQELAREIGSVQQNIRRYMELKISVPKPVQDLIAEKLGLDHHVLFSADRPLDSHYKWAAKLRECLRESSLENASELADRIDTEVIWVRAWMEQEVCGEETPPYCGQVQPTTQPILAEALGCSVDTLFRVERAAGDFKWVVMPQFEDEIRNKGGIDELASRLDLDVARIERWIAGSESVAPGTQLAILQDLGSPVDELARLFTSRPPVDPEKPEGARWATGLRAAVREHPSYLTLGRLAAELQISAKSLFDKVEMLEPVPEDLCQRIKRLLGPTSAQGGPLFTAQGPDWSEFQWSPTLRSALEKAQMSASELATELDVDLERVQDWMEMDQGPARTLWAKEKVKRGQICPATRKKIDLVLDVGPGASPFSAAVPHTVSRWAVKPIFEMAVLAFDDGLLGFAEQIDVDPERVKRWCAQEEPVGSAARKRILDVLGLKETDEAQLFADEKRVENAVG